MDKYTWRALAQTAQHRITRLMRRGDTARREADGGDKRRRADLNSYIYPPQRAARVMAHRALTAHVSSYVLRFANPTHKHSTRTCTHTTLGTQQSSTTRRNRTRGDRRTSAREAMGRDAMRCNAGRRCLQIFVAIVGHDDFVSRFKFLFVRLNQIGIHSNFRRSQRRRVHEVACHVVC